MCTENIENKNKGEMKKQQQKKLFYISDEE